MIRWTKSDVIKKFQEAMTSPGPPPAGGELVTKFREITQKRKAGAGAELLPATE
jgi:hypothetical protein